MGIQSKRHHQTIAILSGGVSGILLFGVQTTKLSPEGIDICVFVLKNGGVLFDISEKHGIG